MGRKIPGRKHRGVKDPIVQQQNRLTSLKGKINAPPKNSDDQEIPKRLATIMELCKKVKSGEISDKRKSKKKKAAPVTSAPKYPYAAYEPSSSKGRPEKPVPVFTQGPDEKTHIFLQRINRTVNEVLQEAKFEDKYGVTVERDPTTGNISFKKDKTDDVKNSKSKNKKITKPKTTGSNDKGRTSVPSTEINKNTIPVEKTRKEVEKTQNDFHQFQDSIKFGEVVHAPPNISVLPKYASKSFNTVRPGQKNLLLKQNLVNSTKPTVKKKKTVEIKNALSEKNRAKFDTKGKRKDLPLLMRKQLEVEQKSAMKAYRLLKNNKTTDIVLKPKI